MSKKDKIIFQVLHVIAWIILIGLIIDAAALTVNFIFSIFKPGVVGNLFEKLDLTTIYHSNKYVFFGLYGFVLAIAYFKVHLFYIVTRLINKLDLTKPFNNYVSSQIKSISYYTLAIGLISHIGREISKNFDHYGFDVDSLSRFWADSQAYILMAAVIYIIAIIFARGVELQNENDLTV